MQNSFTETAYPLDFRKSDAEQLGKHLRHRHSVELIGMRRVGISNFLRFFLYRQNILPTYIDNKKHLFIPVDLNDLIEREIFPFWRLTFKRILDSVGASSSVSAGVKKNISTHFLGSIQSNDLFLTVDGIRQSLITLVKENILPTLFLIRFDRLKEAVIPEFFDNLQGLKDATGQKLVYVFTSFRPLDQIAPAVFQRKALSVFSHRLYVQPAKPKDSIIIFTTLKKKYQLHLDQKTEAQLTRLAGGHVQYLQLALIILNEQRQKHAGVGNELTNLILADERITLQSEELFESFTLDEQTLLKKIVKGQKITHHDLSKAQYLLDTGCLTKIKKDVNIFSPLLADYLRRKEPARNGAEKNGVDFTKKENALFLVLQTNLNQICEREKIVAGVWPEASEIGISDWAIDRLVARVRVKLKKQNSPFEIVTVKTRGYKLVNSA